MKPNAKMKFQSWKTTDEEERAKRRERASVESMKVRTVDAPDGFGIYEVSHPAADRRTARYALGAVPVEREIMPVTIEELVVVEGELDLPQECELVLQLAVQGLDIPRPLDSARALVEQCRATWK